MRPNNKKVKYAIVTYGKDAETVFDLQSFDKKKAIKKTFKKVPKTNRYKIADLTGALQYVEDSVFTAEKGDDPDSPNGIIILTDQASKKVVDKRLKDVAKSLEGNNVGVYAIGIGTDKTLQAEINMLSGNSTNTNSFMVKDYVDLVNNDELTKSVAAAFRPFCECIML